MKRALPTTNLRTPRNTLAILTACGILYRVATIAGTTNLPPLLDGLILAANIATFAGAFLVGWQAEKRRRVLAEQDAKVSQIAVARLQRQTKEEQEAEERSWWQGGTDEDTVAFGPNVIRLDTRRFADSA